VDVIAEHCTGIAVGAGNRRAGKGHERGIGQRIAQMLGVTHFVAIYAGFFIGFELGLEAVLGAVRFVGNHHDIVAIREHREGIFIFARHEFLNRGKHNAARRPVAQFGAQVASRFGLHGLFTQ